jgi:hypothetical protein
MVLMAGVISASGSDLKAVIADQGFAFVQNSAMRSTLRPFGSTADWDEFAASWNRLQLDTYMADGGRYRKRRHAVYRAEGDAVVRQTHQPHFQSIDYNPLNGGIARWFEPIEPEVGSSATMATILAFCRSLFDQLAQGVRAWHIEVHQFRIEARSDQAGKPAPEGVHRDGVDYVLVLLVNRRNIESGVTTIHALDGSPLGQFTLTVPFDAAIVNDARVAHGVTPVEPLDSSAEAFRDVLVVTFRREAPADSPLS